MNKKQEKRLFKALKIISINQGELAKAICKKTSLCKIQILELKEDNKDE